MLCRTGGRLPFVPIDTARFGTSFKTCFEHCTQSWFTIDNVAHSRSVAYELFYLRATERKVGQLLKPITPHPQHDQQHTRNTAPNRPRDSQLAESHAHHSTAREKARHTAKKNPANH